MPAAIPFIVNVGMAYAGFSATAVAFATLAAGVVVGQYERDRAEKKARDAYNRGLTDRTQTLRSAVTTRKYVLGMVRTGGTLMYGETIGPNKTAFDSVLATSCNKTTIVGYYLNDDYVPVALFPGDKYGHRDIIPQLDRDYPSTEAGQRVVTLAYTPATTVRVWLAATGDSGDYEITPVTVNGNQVTYQWPGGYGVAEISYGSYGPSKFQVQWKDGDPAQTSTPWAGYDSPEWTSAHRLQGVSHVRALMLWDENVFATGAPNISVLVQGGWIDGHPFYDPRTESYPNYTDNPALLAAWWATLPRKHRGCGIPSSWIDWEWVKAAANVCDELIQVRTLDGSGYEWVKRYQCHTVLDTANSAMDNLDIILGSMAGARAFTAGMYRFAAGAFRPAEITITDDDLVGNAPLDGGRMSDGGSSVNVVTATFADSSKKYQETSPMSVRNQVYIDDDGSEYPEDFPLPATTDPRQANYLMGVHLERRRPAFSFTMKVGGIGENLALLDTVQLSIGNRPQYSGKTFEILEIEDTWNGEFTLTLREIRDTTYNLDPDRYTPVNQPLPPDLSYLWTVSSLTGFTASLGTPQLFPDGTSVTTITLTWDLHSQPYVRSNGRIELRYRQVGTDLWIGIPPSDGSSTGTAFAASLVDTAAYEFQARARNGIGAISPWVSTFEIVDGEAVVIPSLRIRASSTVFRVDASSVGAPSEITLEPVFGGPLTGPVTWTVLSGTINSLGVSGDSRTVAFADMLSDIATIQASATYGTTTYTDLVSLIKVYDGTAGPPGTAKLLQLTASSQVFQVSKTGVGSPSAISFTAAGQNLTGSPSFSITGGTLSGTGNTRTLTFAAMTSDTATVTCTWDGQTDIVTVVKLHEGQDGSSPVVSLLTSEAHVVAASAAGVVSAGDLVNAFTYMKVYVGLTDDTANWSFAKVDSMGVVSSLVTSGADRGKVTVTDLSDDTAFIDITATRSGYPTQTKRFVISKSRIGATGPAGSNAKLIYLAANSQVFRIDKVGNVLPSSITLTASAKNLSGSPSFSITGGTLTGTGSVRTLTFAAMTAETAQVTVTQDGQTDTITIVKVREGADGTDGQPAVVAFLTNESHTVAANSAGVVASLADALTYMKVYIGTTDDTANWTYTRVNGSAGVTSTINYSSTKGLLKIDTLIVDQAYVDITASKSGFPSITKRFTISKSRAGADGQAGSPGADAITGILTNEAIVLPADSAGAVTSYVNANTTMAIFKGTVDDSSNWTYTRVLGSGVTTATLAGNVLTITAVTSAMVASYVDITATRPGYPSVTKRVRITKAKQGAQGVKGDTGSTGTRGTVQIAAGIAGSTWSDSAANTALSNAGYGTAINRDIVTLYSTTTSWSEARVSIGGAWTPLNAYISGSMVVEGSLLAENFAADSITTEKMLVKPPGTALTSDPRVTSLSQWTKMGGTGTLSNDTAGTYFVNPEGGVGNIYSNGTVVFRSNIIECDPLQTYVATGTAVRGASNAATMYLLVAFYDASMNVVYNAGGTWPAEGTYNYFGIVGQLPPTSVTDYSIRFGRNANAKIPAGAKYMAVGAILNYSGATNGANQHWAGTIKRVADGASLVVVGGIDTDSIRVGAVSAPAELISGFIDVYRPSSPYTDYSQEIYVGQYTGRGGRLLVTVDAYYAVFGSGSHVYTSVDVLATIGSGASAPWIGTVIRGSRGYWNGSAYATFVLPAGINGTVNIYTRINAYLSQPISSGVDSSRLSVRLGLLEVRV